MKMFSLIRSFMAAIFYPFFLVLSSILTILVHFIFRNRNFDNNVVCFWGQASCKMFGVDVEVLNKEKIPHGACLYLFNHSSFFDIFAMHGWMRGVRFGAKIELFSIPFFGAAMRGVGVLPIARNNVEEVKKVYADAAERVARGEKFALAPEGTRNPGEGLLSFKSGPFLFALSTSMPIVPVVIHGAREILPKSDLLPNKDQWYRKIQVEVLDPIDVQGYDPKNKKILMDQVYQKMNHCLMSKTQR